MEQNTSRPPILMAEQNSRYFSFNVGLDVLTRSDVEFYGDPPHDITARPSPLWPLFGGHQRFIKNNNTQDNASSVVHDLDQHPFYDNTFMYCEF